uniref:DDE-1 domain-containing protein n=1 Tax=Branchiostoma floridae TaxID=7739 RepID=C3XUF1_BRAFL|eukprot:XP_002612516.1 hypothetical protein BRAFLDRAFT_75362 [Branchiostoma floridae]
MEEDDVAIRDICLRLTDDQVEISSRDLFSFVFNGWDRIKFPLPPNFSRRGKCQVIRSFTIFMRIEPEMFRKMVEDLTPRIRKTTTNYRKSLSPGQWLAVTLGREETQHQSRHDGGSTLTPSTTAGHPIEDYSAAKQNSAGKQFKDRVTIMLCASMTGNKEKPLNPRCSTHVKLQTLPVTYRNNQEAWMTSDHFVEW